jgi:hypothetical protein
VRLPESVTVLVPPKVLKPVRRQRRVDRGTRDRPIAEPALARPGMGLELQPGAGSPRYALRPSLESRGDQLGDAVAPENDGSEAPCNDEEKKRGG